MRRRSTALGPHRVGSADLEFAIRQLVEVAVRALSPGINDPHTAISVLERLGAALCDVAPLQLNSGVTERNGSPAPVVPRIDCDGLVDAMFHMIRQNADGSAAVLIRMLEILTSVVACEFDPDRRNTLLRHADLVLGDAERDIDTPQDLDDARHRYETVLVMQQYGPTGVAAGRSGSVVSPAGICWPRRTA